MTDPEVVFHLLDCHTGYYSSEAEYLLRANKAILGTKREIQMWTGR